MAELKIDVTKCAACKGVDRYDVRIFSGERWATVKTDGLGPAMSFAMNLGQLLAGAGHEVVYSGLCSAGGA